MAITFDVAATGHGNGVNSINLGALSTAGANELLVMVISYSNGSVTNATSISGGGLTWSSVTTRVANNGSLTNGYTEWWYTLATSQLSSTVFTVSFGGSAFPQATAVVAAFQNTILTGTHGSGAIGASTTATGSTTSPSNAVTTTANNSLVIGMLGIAKAVSVSAGTSQTMAATVQESEGVFSTSSSDYQNSSTASSGTSVTSSFTGVGSNPWAMMTLELLAASTNLTVSVSDSPTTSENISFLTTNFISVNDATTTSENLSVTEVSLINVNDATTTSEMVTGNIATGISVSDASTTSESVTVKSFIGDINVNDSTTTSEFVGYPTDTVFVADSAIVSFGAITINVSDSTTTSENITVSIHNKVNVSDATTTSENITFSFANIISVNDATTTSESISPSFTNFISVSDATTTSENIVTIVTFYLITVADATNSTDIRHNYVTNPSFETDSIGTNPPATFTNFTTLNTGTLTRAVANDTSFNGGQSWKLTETGGTADAGIVSLQYVLTPGTYTVSHYMKTTLSAGAAHLHVKVYSSGNVTAEYDLSGTSGTTGWTRYSLAITLGVNDTAMELWLGAGAFGDAFATGSVWYDALQIEQNSTLGSYFDGTFPNAVWDGTPGLSASSTALTVVSATLVYLISVNDSSTTSESLTVRLPLTISVNDATTTSENLSINTVTAVNDSISVNDAPVTSESFDVLLNSTRNITVSDSVVTSESFTTLASFLITGIETVKVVEGFLSMLNFNGINQDVITSYNSLLQPINAVTVEAWAYHNNWASETSPKDIFSNTISGGYALRVNDTGQTTPAVGLTVRSNNSVFQRVSTSMASFASGWHHFIGTFDGRFLRIYVDGNLGATTDLGSTFTIQYSFNNGNGIGSSVDQHSPANGTGNYWTEQIGQVRVYGRALSATEVTQHFNQNYVNEANRAAVYYFPEGSGTSTSDSSGNNVTGTLVNSPNWQPSTMPLTGLVSLDEDIIVSDATTTSDVVTNRRSTLEPFVSDAPTTSESVTPYIPFMVVIANDTVSTADVPSFGGDLYIRLISASISVSDNSGWIFFGFLNDITTTSENVTVGESNNPSVNDATTTSENVTIALIQNPFTFDASSTTESVAVSIHNKVNVIDATTTSENIFIQGLDIGIVLSDSSSTSESVTASLTNTTLVSDASTTSENTTMQADENAVVADTATSSENITPAIENNPFVADIPGGVGNFNGINNYINTNAPFNFLSTDSFTIAAWVKSTTTGAAQTYSIIDKGYGFPNTWGLLYKTAGVGLGAYPNFGINDGSTGIIAGSTSGVDISDGKWHLIVGVRDVTNDALFVYTDGILQATLNDTTTGGFTTSGAAFIGARGPSIPAQFFTGQIADARIYNVALSSNNVRDLFYNSTTPYENPTNELGFWKMDDGSGSNVTDYSGNTNNGTWQGTLGNQWQGGVIDVARVRMTTNISVADSVSTSENITFSTTNFLSVIDNPSTSENISNLIASALSVFDATTTSENSTVLQDEDRTVFDATTTSENISILLTDFVVIFDSSSTSENVQIALPETLSVIDATTTSESVAVSPDNNISVFDTTTTSESILVVSVIIYIPLISDSVTTTENIVEVVTLFISQNENVTTSEALTVVYPLLQTSVSDSVTTSENISTLFNILDLSVFDSVTYAETLVIGQIKINVFESVSTTESYNVSYPRFINISDIIMVGELWELQTPGILPPVIVSETFDEYSALTSGFTDGGE